MFRKTMLSNRHRIDPYSLSYTCRIRGDEAADFFVSFVYSLISLNNIFRVKASCSLALRTSDVNIASPINLLNVD